MRFNMVNSSEGRSTIVIFGDNGDTDMVTDSHPNYVRIAKALIDGVDPTEWLNANPRKIVESLSERVEIIDGVLHFDGDAVYDGLASTIGRYHREGRDATNLVRFMERLSANPSYSSRQQLFNWTDAKSLTIDADGYIIGYKGVMSRPSDQDYLDDDGQPLFPLDKYPFQSSGTGLGIVDGIEISGHLPMGVGVTVAMPRSEVNDNPNQGCSTGLHVGNYSYAQGYSTSGALLEVKFDPADVVSVPADCSFAKLRCCAYTGVAIHDEDLGDDLTGYEPNSEWDEEDAFDSFVEFVPQGFLDRLRDRILNRGGR